MPFKSEAQRRLFHSMEARHEISPKKVEEWEHATPKETKKRLPYHVDDRRKNESEKKSMDQAYEAGVKLALYEAGLLKQADAPNMALGGAGLGGVTGAALGAKLLGRKALLPGLLLGGGAGALLGSKMGQ